MVRIVIKGGYYHYYPRYFDNIFFDDICEELKDKCQTYDNIIKGKVYKSKRASCVFSAVEVERIGNANSKLFSYTQIPTFDWSTSPLVNYIKMVLETKLGTYFDYCLAHYYASGASTINWHNDKEALETDVVSVSLGCTRKFRFRKIGQKQGWIREFHLGHGDVFHMLEGCQKILEHCVPVEKRVLGARINLTFRKA